MAKQRLGRGFDILIPTDLDKTILEEDKSRVQNLLISEIEPNPDQPRREMDKNSLESLSSSIKRYGVLQPIIVVKSDNGNRFNIVAGERRWRASQAAGLTRIPAIVRSLKELERIELALIENIQRVDLSPLEQALSVYRLQHSFNLSLEEIAKRLGKATSTVSNLARLLKLPEAGRLALQQQKITEGHARAILSISSYPSKQEELLRCILDNNWNVRQAEKFASEVKKGKTVARRLNENEITKTLSNKLQTKVKIKISGVGGQLIIPFRSEEELAKITKKMGLK